MWSVRCPDCDEPVLIPDEARGPERSDPWNVVCCDTCGLVFDFDDAEVVAIADGSPGE